MKKMTKKFLLLGISFAVCWMFLCACGSIDPEPLQVHHEEETDAQDYELVDELIFDDYGAEIIISTVEDIAELKLILVSYNEDGSFTESAHLWDRDELKSTQAVKIKTSIPDVMPNIKISYRLKDDTLVERYLTQSGKDGSLILLTPEEVL